jgi:hypothetical protein
MEMNEPCPTIKVDFDNWAATPLAVRQMLLALRSGAAMVAKSIRVLAVLESHPEQIPQKYPLLHSTVSQMITTLGENAEAAQAQLDSDDQAALSPATRELLQTLCSLAAQAAPLHQLLTGLESNTADVREQNSHLNLALHEQDPDLRAAAETIDHIFTLLAHLSDDLQIASEQLVQLRQGMEGYLKKERYPSPSDGVDEIFKRVSRRIEEGQRITDLRAYCYRAAQLLRMESWRKPKEEEFNEKSSRLLQGDDKGDNKQRRFACMKQCEKRLPLETRWLMREYADPIRLGENPSQCRKELATLLGVSRQQLINRVRSIREGLYKCVEICLEKQSDSGQ